MSMGSILLKISPAKLANPDLDIRYMLPDKISEISEGRITDDGYDYDDSDNMLVFLRSEQPRRDVTDVLYTLKKYDFKGNMLYGKIDVYLSDKSDEELDRLNYDISVYAPYPNRLTCDLEYASKRLTLICRYQPDFARDILIPEIESNCEQYNWNPELTAYFRSVKAAENSLYFHHLYTESNIPAGTEYDYLACLSTTKMSNGAYLTKPVQPIIPCRTKVLCFFTNYRPVPIKSASCGHHENCLIQFQCAIPQMVELLYEINEKKQIDCDTRICLFSSMDEEYQAYIAE